MPALARWIRDGWMSVDDLPVLAVENENGHGDDADEEFLCTARSNGVNK